MFRYYMWALAEKGLSVLPGGGAVYSGVGAVVNRNQKGYGDQIATAFPIAKRVRELVGSTGDVVDMGTGWFHHDAMLLYLVGDYRIVLFDVQDKARMRYIKNYVGNLLSKAGVVASELGITERRVRERLEPLLRFDRRRDLYDHCNFELVVSSVVDRPFGPAGSVDLIVSNCVLVHIRPDVVVQELSALRSMLRPGGHMFHMLGHDDHWAFHDPSMSWPSFNYYRYSERFYSLLFETRFEYQNRLPRTRWEEIFRASGLRIDEYETVVTDESRDAIRRLPHVAGALAGIPLDDLAAIYSYVLLSPADTESART